MTLKKFQDREDYLTGEITEPKQAKHTPTPWIMKQGLGLPGSHEYFVGESVDGKNTAFQALKRADAEQIVRAVNSHEEVLNAMRTVSDWLHSKAVLAYDETKRHGYAHNKVLLDNAIAKAEGK